MKTFVCLLTYSFAFFLLAAAAPVGICLHSESPEVVAEKVQCFEFERSETISTGKRFFLANGQTVFLTNYRIRGVVTYPVMPLDPADRQLETYEAQARQFPASRRFLDPLIEKMRSNMAGSKRSKKLVAELVDETAKKPDITLPNGTKLTDCSVAKIDGSTVTVVHSAGIRKIDLADLSDATKSELGISSISPADITGPGLNTPTVGLPSGREVDEPLNRPADPVSPRLNDRPSPSQAGAPPKKAAVGVSDDVFGGGFVLPDAPEQSDQNTLGSHGTEAVDKSGNRSPSDGPSERGDAPLNKPAQVTERASDASNTRSQESKGTWPGREVTEKAETDDLVGEPKPSPEDPDLIQQETNAPTPPNHGEGSAGGMLIKSLPFAIPIVTICCIFFSLRKKRVKSLKPKQRRIISPSIRTMSSPQGSPTGVIGSNWYYESSGKTYGPFSKETMHQMKCAGIVSGSTLVRRDGKQDWQPYETEFPDALESGDTDQGRSDNQSSEKPQPDQSPENCLKPQSETGSTTPPCVPDSRRAEKETKSFGFWVVGLVTVVIICAIAAKNQRMTFRSLSERPPESPTATPIRSKEYQLYVEAYNMGRKLPQRDRETSREAIQFAADMEGSSSTNTWAEKQIMIDGFYEGCNRMPMRKSYP